MKFQNRLSPENVFLKCNFNREKSCYEWTGTKDSYGYGVTSISTSDKKTLYGRKKSFRNCKNFKVK